MPLRSRRSRWESKMERRAQPFALMLGIAGAAVALALAARLARRRPSERAAAEPSGTAARRVGEGDVRSAGPEGMRREAGRRWNSIDQASDQSFPASDPPSTY